MDFEIYETEVDGVPTLWTPGQGPMTAILSFRVGVADEPVPRRGITHLVEHLALGPLGNPDFDHNGGVDLFRTMFVVTGSQGECVNFLSRVAAGLADLSTDRLLLERAVLNREAAEQPPSLGLMLRGYRCGPVGAGKAADVEHGVGWLGPVPVRQWAAERFVRENAFLVLNREPPADLRLPLGSGRRWPAPESPNPSWLSLPAHGTWPHVGAAMTMTMARGTPANNMAVSILHRRLRTALRFEGGLVYDVAFDFDALDAATAHATFGADADERNVAEVTRRFLDVTDQLIAEGPTAEELAAELTAVEQGFDHPDGRFGYLDFQAVERLSGRDTFRPDELLQRRAAVQPVDVQTVLADASQRMMMFSSAPNPAPDRLADYPAWSVDAVTGEAFPPAGFRLFGRGDSKRMILGPDGLSLRVPPGQVTVRFADVVASVHLPGRRIIIGSDGFRLDVEAAFWRNGQRLIDAIDAAVPIELVACDTESPGALVDPEGRS